MVAFIIQWLIGTSLVLIWDFINVIQYVSYLPLMEVRLPENVQKIYRKNTEFTNFQVLPTDELDYITYGLEEDDKVPYNSNFELAGHEANLFILGIGTLWYVLYFLILVMLLKLLFRKQPRVYQKLHKLATLNSLVRFHMQAFFNLCLCAIVNIETADW